MLLVSESNLSAEMRQLKKKIKGGEEGGGGLEIRGDNAVNMTRYELSSCGVRCRSVCEHVPPCV